MTTLSRPGAAQGHVCGIDTAMEVIGGKWKVLASHLREMEADGVVRRVAYDEVPPRVEYSLTEEGTRLNEALRPLAAWGRDRSTAGQDLR
ncbi:winged helix-turn-helix transcriptional regulator [Streptomyces justiciae]|uniref:Helix-turn-helix domain-containing protein n=1 Tax=Streptomyces justiciae TaxID=2780140 RepID=A0ABU3LVL7_9ACTN|nr:helix-turn-helix domain-containing protein [Streptomyces justiciae]MDT7843286.1 helix-turn-helix domain-containing protein [Streptomyces justiciae]